MAFQVARLAIVLTIQDVLAGASGLSRGDVCIDGEAVDVGSKLLQVGTALPQQALPVGEARRSVDLLQLAGSTLSKPHKKPSRPVGGEVNTKVAVSTPGHGSATKAAMASKRSATERAWRAWLQRSSLVDAKAAKARKREGQNPTSSSASAAKGKPATAKKGGKVAAKEQILTAKDTVKVKQATRQSQAGNKASPHLQPLKKQAAKAAGKTAAKAGKKNEPVSKVVAKGAKGAKLAKSSPEQGAKRSQSKAKQEDDEEDEEEADEEEDEEEALAAKTGPQLAATKVKPIESKTAAKGNKVANAKAKGKQLADARAAAAKEKGAKSMPKHVKLAAAHDKAKSASKKGQSGKMKANDESEHSAHSKGHKAGKLKAAEHSKQKKKHHHKSENDHAGSLSNPVIGSVIFLMSAPAGILLLAFGAFLWVRSQDDDEMGAG